MNINDTPSYALLLEDVQGHKEHFSDTACVPSFEQVEIPKGSLIESLAASDATAIKEVHKFQVNYIVYSSSIHGQSGIFLFASLEQLYKLTMKQRDLLLAVDALADRVKVFSTLRWIESLGKDSEVATTVDSIPVPIKGVIRYIGELPGLDGTRFGVELMERREVGDSDGSYQGQHCFKCDNNSVVFVSMDMLTDYKAVDAAKPSDEPVPGKVPSVRIDDYVTFSDVHDHRHRGLVKWIGTDKSLLSDGTTIVGIEAETLIDLNGIPQLITIPSGCDYFSIAKQGSKVFLPVYCVQREIAHDDKGDGHKDDHVTVESHDELQNDLTHQQSNTDTDDTSSKPQSSKHDDGFSGLDVFPNPHCLKVGSVIEYGEQSGDIKWIGVLPEIKDKNLMAGVEMDGDVEEESDDGCWAGVEYYTCKPNRGIFVDVTVLQPYSGPRPRRLPKDQNPHKLEVGSVIRYGDPPKYGVIKWLGTFQPLEKVLYAGIEMDEPVDKATDGMDEGKEYFKCCPGRGKFVRVSTLQPGQRPVQHYTPPLRKVQHQLEVGSAIQLGNTPQYGTIKEISLVRDEQMAKVEWEFGGCNKIRLSELQPDERFIIDVNDTTGQLNPLEANLYEHDEREQPVVPPEKFDENKHTETKGIQGCHNSCYLDATLYGLFAFSDAFDVALLNVATTGGEEQHVQKILKNKIIYPLRVMSVVLQDSTQVFRTHLANLQEMRGFSSDEKDPEEFLNFLFKHVLQLDPFVHIRRPSGIDQEFLIQLFVEPIEGVSIVYTQELLTKMFLDQNISFVKNPSRLLLQMPRYGKNFKSFQCIIPSLELDIRELYETKNKQCCNCNKSSNCVCSDCSNEPDSKELYLCNDCSVSWHNHPSRQSHRPCQLKSEPSNDFRTGKLQLLSVLCIETSHYVCFTRATRNDWVFFDSMAERLDNGYNLPKVTVCTQLLQEHVYGEKDITGVQSKSLPELVRRFVEDVYMCIYVESDHN